MARVLPPEPSLDHLKNEAKSLLKGHKATDSSVCTTLRLLRRFADAAEVLGSDLSLHEAQFALALDYGFRSWDDLRTHVLGLTTPVTDTEPRPGALLLADRPSGRARSNRIVSGIGMLLSSAGIEADYDTLMGDSGACFILQADSFHTAWGKPVKQIDIGWWPLDPWGVFMRLDFLGRTVGRQVILVESDLEEFRADPRLHYSRRFEESVRAALRDDIACLAVTHDWCAITGLDDGEPPLLGVVSCADDNEQVRLREYPWSLLTLGGSTGMQNRSDADVSALAHAVALATDDASALARTVPDCPVQGIGDGSGKTTGRRSFALWAHLLRDPDGWGANLYHANVVGQLRISRSSAPIYLRHMAERHPEAVAAHLKAAAAVYDDLLDRLHSADTSEETLGTSEGRERLASLVDELSDVEGRAVESVTKALAAME